MRIDINGMVSAFYFKEIRYIRLNDAGHLFELKRFKDDYENGRFDVTELVQVKMNLEIEYLHDMDIYENLVK